MKVVHILNTGKYSGAENVAIQIIDYLKRNTDIEAVYVSLEGSIRDTLEKHKIKFYPVEKMNLHSIRKMVTELKPDILHCHDYTTSIIAAFASTQKIISHLHNNSPWLTQFGLKSFEFLISIPRYSKVLLVSNSIKNEYVFSKCLSKKTDTIGNPIDVRAIKYLGERSNHSGKYDICFLGRLSLQKNPILFVEIVHRLTKKHPLVKACMIGDGELRQQVEQKIIDLKMEEKIDLLGFQENPYMYLNNSKFLLATSEWEGYGLFAAEALVLGKPVVCTNVGGLPTIVDDRCGVVCSSEEELLRACEKMLSDPKYYHEKHKGTKRRSVEFPNIESYMGKIIKLYEALQHQNPFDSKL